MFKIIQQQGVKSTSLYLKKHFQNQVCVYTTAPQSGLVLRDSQKLPWIEGPGSLGFSLALISDQPVWAGMVMAYTIARQVKGLIKWPNDVILAHKKLAGLIVYPGPGHQIIIGVGLNLNNKTFDPQIAAKAISLYQVIKKTTNPELFLKKLLGQFTINLKTLNWKQINNCQILKNKTLVIGSTKYQFLQVQKDGQAWFLVNGQKKLLTKFDLSLTSHYHQL